MYFDHVIKWKHYYIIRQSSRLMALNEHGLTKYWMEDVPNLTVCDSIPKKLLVTSHISVSNIWVRDKLPA